MRIHRSLQIILILILGTQMMVAAQEAELKGKHLSRNRKDMTASIVRINILKAYNDRSNEVPRSVIFNGSIIDSYHPKVVEIYPTVGVVLDNNGHILTYLGERWVSLGIPPHKIEIFVPGDRSKAEGTFVGVDERTGFAVIASPGVKLQPAKIEAPNHFKVGSMVYMIDFLPKAPEPAIKPGRVRKLEVLPPNGMRLVVSAESSYENEYGDPVVDLKGNIIGICTGLIKYPGAPRGLAQKTVFPMTEIMPVVQKIISTGHSIPSGWIGVYLDELTPALKQKLNLKADHGILVRDVVKDGPAQRAGILKNDVIVRYGGTAVTSMRQFVQLVRETPIGQKVAVTIIRDNKPSELWLTIERRKEKTLQEQLFRIQPLEIDAQELEERLLRMQEQLRQTELKLQERNQAQTRQLQKQFEAIQKSLSEAALANPFVASSRRPTLGLFTDNLTAQLGEYFGVKGGKGVLITSVTEGSPSEKAGLKAGDVIVKIDGAEVPNRLTLARQLGRRRIGDKIKVSVIRDKNPMDFYLTMEQELRFGPKPRR